MKEIIAEKVLFLDRFVKAPRCIGSITPSSPFLAQAMIKPIDWPNIRSIVELGAGTGVFTQYIHQLKHSDCKGIIFEQDHVMRQRLTHLYQGLDYRSQAEDINSVIHELGLSEVDCILSGLPFSNFTQGLCDQIIDGVTLSLKQGGLFIQFQYSLQMKNQLLKRFSKIDFGFVPLNIPPAFIYYCYK